MDHCHHPLVSPRNSKSPGSGWSDLCIISIPATIPTLAGYCQVREHTLLYQRLNFLHHCISGSMWQDLSEINSSNSNTLTDTLRSTSRYPYSGSFYGALVLVPTYSPRIGTEKMLRRAIVSIVDKLGLHVRSCEATWLMWQAKHEPNRPLTDALAGVETSSNHISLSLQSVQLNPHKPISNSIPSTTLQTIPTL